MTSAPKNCDAPPPRLKNHPELGKNGRSFGFLVGAPRVLGEGVNSPEHYGPLSRRSESEPLKIGILEGPSPKNKAP